MPVVSGKSNLIHGTFDYGADAPDPQAAKGRLILATGTVANAADDSNASMYELARIPSQALLHEATFFDVENWGFAQVVIGTKTDTDALLDVARSAANVQSPIAIGDAHHGKPLWEILGLAADPGGDISLWAHAEAGATGAGTMPFRIAYIMP